MDASGAGERSLRRDETVAALGIVVVGVLWHFAYDWSGGSAVVAAIAPANESVWEHLKLVVVPVLAVGALEAARPADRRRLWWATWVEITTMCVFVVAFFYTYTGALGVHSIVLVDIASFVLAVVGGQVLRFRILTSSSTVPVPAAVSVTALMMVVLLLAVLTFAPPHIPLFQETATGTYGPS